MARVSVSFELLDIRIRQWIWKQGWTSLKDIQENAIPIVLEGKSDVIISASTAGGKTEAAFLPILTSLLQNDASNGFQVLYISPLKALINDQYRRLLDMTTETGINVTPWHGDIDMSQKKRSLKNPNGIIIITPESLESFLINRRRFLPSAFSSLRYVVIDELHSFIGTERGKQLQSLLTRIEQITMQKIPRIAMSATFSDYSVVKCFLRDDESLPCAIPLQGNNNHEIKILVKEYIQTRDIDVTDSISQEIYKKLRGSNNLVFTNDRGCAELYGVHLSDMCEINGVPNEFRVHHGSISKIERESIERDLQKGECPVTVFCTSTLELGIDVGKVKSIAQIGTVNSVSGLRQRLGRSGRRNAPSILRVFSIENRDSGLLYNLRSSLVQNIAVIELMRQHKYEKPSINNFHFSTLIQQILAVIAQFGGFYPKDGWLMLCKNGAFKNVTPELFLEVLKSLANKDVISQLKTGQIVVGKLGEKILKSPEFYVAFVSPTEFAVINSLNSRHIGMIQYKPQKNMVIILSGKRWIVEDVDENTMKVYVSNMKTGGLAFFNGDGAELDCMIAEKMYEIYQIDTIYPYLDDNTEAKHHLNQGRLFFQQNGLSKTFFLQHGDIAYFFTWAGTKTNRAIALLFQYCLNKECYYNGLYVLNVTEEDIDLLKCAKMPSATEIVSNLPRQCKIFQKYDYLLSNKLLDIEFSTTHIDFNLAKDIIFRK